jgi:S1-C subfamily serine protease/peroxiredoxin
MRANHFLAFGCPAFLLLTLIGCTRSSTSQTAETKAAQTDEHQPGSPSVASVPQGVPSAGSAAKDAVPAITPPAADSGGAPARSHTQTIEMVDDGIVLIKVFDKSRRQIALGTGFVIDQSGSIATNYHVIEKATSAQAQFRDGTEVAVAGFLAWDTNHDLVILSLSDRPPGMEVLQLSATDPGLASDVIAIGHPSGFKFTISRGIVAAIRRASELSASDLESLNQSADTVWIQTDAVISQGSSGGPLLNAAGQVVGINTWLANDKLAFAVHVRHLLELMKRQRESVVPMQYLADAQGNLQQLIAEMHARRSSNLKSAQATESPEERQRLLVDMDPGIEFAPRFLSLAEEYRDTPAAFSALQEACKAVRTNDSEAAGEVIRRATSKVLENHLDNPSLLRFLVDLNGGDRQEAWDFIRAVADKSSSVSLRGVALYVLAKAMHHAEDGERIAESTALFEEIDKNFSEIPAPRDLEPGSPRKTLGSLARDMLFQMRYLDAESESPDIAGVDAQGVEFKLSDYRDKFVLLSFLSNGKASTALQQRLQRIQQQFKNAPLVLLSVRTDQTGQAGAASGGPTWRCWQDSPDREMSNRWRVAQLPTVFLIDAKGVIRQKLDGATLKGLEPALLTVASEAGLTASGTKETAPVAEAKQSPVRSGAEPLQANPGTKQPAAPSRPVESTAVTELQARIQSIYKARGETQDQEKQLNLSTELLDVSNRLLDLNPEGNARVVARSAWFDAAAAIAYREGRKAAPLFARLDQLADDAIAQTHDRFSVAQAYYYRIRIHLEIGPEPGVEPATFLTQMLDSTKQFAIKFPADSRVDGLLETIGRQAIRNNRPEIGAAAYRFLIDGTTLKPLEEHAQRMLRKVEMVGRPLALAGTTLEEKSYDLEQLKGKYVLVNFWAGWSQQAPEEAAILRRLQDAYHEKGLTFVSISADSDKRVLKRFVTQNDIKWPQIFIEDDQARRAFFEQYNVGNIPAYYLVDPQGAVTRVVLETSSIEQIVAEVMNAAP